jgi:endo-1,4-beta-xylanase
MLGIAVASMLAVAGVALSSGTAFADTTITSNATGTNNGYFYSFWQQNSGGTMTLKSGSEYALSWTSATNDIVAGTGWSAGSTAPVTYSGTWNCNGNCYLSLYGWTTNPLVEYYITDNYGDYNPSSGDTKLGSVSSDGSVYDLYEHQQTNQPCITGNSCTFEQYWAIRESKRTGGTITVANIFNAWKALGLNLGTPNYEILATEGYQSSGSSDITVSQGTTQPTPTPTPTPTQSSPTPTPTPTSTSPGGGSGSCTASYANSSSWPGGFNGQVTVKAGSAAISSWKVTLTMPSGETVTSNYNGGYSQSGSTVTLTPASYNGSIAASASTSVGIQGSWTGSSFTAPTSVSCSAS